MSLSSIIVGTEINSSFKPTFKAAFRRGQQPRPDISLIRTAGHVYSFSMRRCRRAGWLGR